MENETLELIFDCEAFCRRRSSPRGIVRYQCEDICIFGIDCPVVRLYHDKERAESRAGNIPPGYGYDPRFGVVKAY